MNIFILTIQESPIRSRSGKQAPSPMAHRSTTSLNEGRGVTTAVAQPRDSRGTPPLTGGRRRQLPQTPGQKTGSELSLTGKGQNALPMERGDPVLENGYQPNMNQHIAMAIRSGQSPYAIYGLEDLGEEDDWC